ncbi:UNVERIFIED_CONTAM: hypothetical protein NCL1_14172 [Trichonephila clavipes]
MDSSMNIRYLRLLDMWTKRVKGNEGILYLFECDTTPRDVLRQGKTGPGPRTSVNMGPHLVLNSVLIRS